MDNHDYAAFARRVIRAQARRIATGDIEELAYLFGLQREIHQAIHTAIEGLRAQGYSWADIALRLGINPPSRPPTLGTPRRCPMTTQIHPTTNHLRKAAGQLRRANRTSKDDYREVVELAETLAASTVVARCLPAMIRHLRSLVSKTDADFYTYDDGSLTAEEALNVIETCLDAAVTYLDNTATALVESWSVLLHLHIHDPDAPESA